MTTEPNYVAVAVATPLRRSFHYRMPAGLPGRRGARVRVPFGNRTLLGLITETDATPDIDRSRIKEILEILPEEGDLPEPILKLCLWASDYYQHPIGEVISTAQPNQLRRGESPLDPIESLTLTDRGRSVDIESLRRAPAQRRLFEILQKGSNTRSNLSLLDVSAQTIRVLIDKNWATWQSNNPSEATPFSLGEVSYGDIELTGEQSDLLQQIEARSSNVPLLLHGVTGS
ncbi:MAG: hypothetical protein JJ854_19155, partial [Pseudomonadales bacterium]|nr:hypothetical protein [Pseudomonadales bacterium]